MIRDTRKALAFLLLLCACERGSAPPYRLWTLDDILASAEEGESYAGIPMATVAAAPGRPIAWLSPPYATAETVNAASLPGLAVLPSFSEGQPVSYLVSEIWQGYPEVWVQPMYVLVTAFDEKSPFANSLKDAKPIFGIDVGSAFYSPYWEVHYVKVPADTPPDRYRSAQQLFDAGLPMKRGPGLFCALSHRPFTIASPAGQKPSRPLSGEIVGTGGDRSDWTIDPARDWGWVDGRKVYVLSLGPDNFSWDEQRYVREDPLFILARRDAHGDPAPIGLPSVGGTGPIGSHTPPDVRNGRPRFGALWRMVMVLVPDSGVVAMASDLPELAAMVEKAGLTTGRVTDALLADDAIVDGHPAPADFTGRVALNPSCFSDPADFPGKCNFLDSQAAVERLSSQSFFPTDVLVACPFVEWAGRKLP